MKTVNVVINEVSSPRSSKVIEHMPKSILPLTLETKQEVGDQDPSPPASPSAIQAPEASFTSPQPKDQVEKEPSSRIKLNHPLNVIVGNMNKLTLRK